MFAVGGCVSRMLATSPAEAATCLGPGYRLEVANVLWLPVSRYQIIPVRYTGVYRYLKCELICIEEIEC